MCAAQKDLITFLCSIDAKKEIKICRAAEMRRTTENAEKATIQTKRTGPRKTKKGVRVCKTLVGQNQPG